DQEKRPPLRKKSLLLIPAAIGLTILMILVLSDDNLPVSVASPPDAGTFSFTSTKVITEGVPNSVIFNYDATSASDQDSIFIQQSWDKQLRRQVKRTESHHTSIYYYPGYFRAKLVVNDRVVKE